ncbi:hypothetical protein Tco_1151005 [Tanacetum coccineum]
MVTTIEEAKDLATFPLDDIIGNLKVYEMILENDGVVSKTTKEKVKSLAFIAKVTKEQTSDDSDSQGGSDEYVEINSATRLIDLEEAVVMVLGTKELKAQDKVSDEPQNEATCLLAVDSQEVQPKPSTYNNIIDLFDLQKENEELLRFNKDFTKTFEKLLKEKRSLESEKSKLLSKINDL